MSDYTDFQTGRLTAIYNQVGNDAAGQPRYVRANFDLLEWASTSSSRRETYVVPLGIERIASEDVQVQNEFQLGREFGYYQIEPLVLDQHQHNGLTDNWIGLHGFGPV